MSAPVTRRSRISRGLRSLFRDDRGDGPTGVIIGAIVFLIIGVGAISAVSSAVVSISETSVDAQRADALRLQVSNFESLSWQQIVQRAGDGLQQMTATPGKSSSNAANTDASTPFPYYSRVSVANNSDLSISTPGGATNSDGSYDIELIAPRIGHKMSECSRFPTQSRPTVASACIYVHGVRAPRFADAVAAPDWKGLTSTIIPQVSGSIPLNSASTQVIANVNTCIMAIDTVRVSFQWSADGSSTLKPISVSHILTDGSTTETSAALTTGSSFIGDFHRGTSSVCGSNDKIAVTWSGSGSGVLSSLLITPVNDTNLVSNLSPGIALNPNLQMDGNGIWSIAWDAPTANTAYPATSYSVVSSCNATPVVIPSAPNVANIYTGAMFILPLNPGESIEQFINRCPVYRITSQAANGNSGPVNTFTLSSIDASFTGIKATQNITTGKITVDYTGFPNYIKNRISSMSAYYCYTQVAQNVGCSVAPITDLVDATDAGTVSTSVNTFSFPTPDRTTVKDSTIWLELITNNSRQATKSGSNVLTMVLQ